MACQPTLPALRSAEAGYVAAVAAQVGGAALQGIQEAGQLINFTKGKDSSAKEVTPDSPDGKGKFAKVSGHKGVAFKHLKTGQIWVKNVKGHGGAQWKVFKNLAAWEAKQRPLRSVFKDGTLL